MAGREIGLTMLLIYNIIIVRIRIGLHNKRATPQIS